jgi:hypothetical protein
MLGRLRDPDGTITCAVYHNPTDASAGLVTLILSRQMLADEAQSKDVRIAEVCRLLLGDFPANLYKLLEEDTEIGEPCVLPSFEDCRQLALKVRGYLGQSYAQLFCLRNDQRYLESLAHVALPFRTSGAVVAVNTARASKRNLASSTYLRYLL